MLSKWYIPPFKPNSNRDKGINIDSKIADVKEFNQEDDTKRRYYIRKFKELQAVIGEMDEEDYVKMQVCSEEKEELLKEIAEFERVKLEKNNSDSRYLRLLGQATEINNIKAEINELRTILDHIAEAEEMLSFKYQEENGNLKYLKEEMLSKEKEKQMYNQEYKSSTRDVLEFNENLWTINRLEKLKFELIENFAEKIKKKKVGFEENVGNFNNSLQSEFRVLKFRLENIEKEISATPSRSLSCPDSAILQIYEQTESEI